MIFAHFFIFLLFVHYVNSKEVLKIGFLKHPNYPQVLGAISLAVQKINNDSNILPKTHLEFIFGDLPSKWKYKISLTSKVYWFDEIFLLFSENNNLVPLRKMTEFRDENISAFIGPDVNCNEEARLASAWNLPMIAFVSQYDKIY